jgi:hypothetical protein
MKNVSSPPSPLPTLAAALLTLGVAAVPDAFAAHPVVSTATASADSFPPPANAAPAAPDSARPRMAATLSRIALDRARIDAAIGRAFLLDAGAARLRARLSRVEAAAREASRHGDLAAGAAAVLSADLDRIERAIPEAR